MLLKTYHTHLNALSIGICGNNINHLCQLYRDIVSKKQCHHGKVYMVKYMKDLNSIAERYSIYQTIEPIKFCKSDHDGFPRELGLFKPYLRNENKALVKMVLSIFRSAELFRLPPSHDIETVVRQPQYNNKVVTDIIRYIPQFVKKLSKLQYCDMIYHFTVKNGPNGPALATSDTDLSAVRQDADIYNSIRIISTKLNDEDFPEENYQTFKNGIHSRLTQFSEKMGKTRTIAVVDYYSQRALYPLHRGLMSLLRGLSSDGTHSHMNVGNYAKQATQCKSFIESSDMTAFTDLFPAIIQKELLFKLEKDTKLANAFWTLLAKRQFTVAWSGESVSYGTGQPMGAYASWPLCTLAHHLIMHYCHYKCKILHPNEQYRIIGDDNVTVNKSVSKLYKETLTAIGCELNPNKGTSSEEGNKFSSAEVAKRLYLNGIDVSPLTPGLIKSLVDPRLVNTSLKDLILTFDNPALPVYILDNLIREDKRSLAWMLCTNPFNGAIKPGNPGYDRHAIYWGDFDDNELYECMKRYRIKSLVDKAAELHSDPGGLLGLWARLQTVPQSSVDLSGQNVKSETAPQYAMVLSQKHTLKLLFRAIRGLSMPYRNINDLVLSEVEYLPDPTCPFMDMKDLRSTRASLLVEKVHTFLEEMNDIYDLEWKCPPGLNI